MASSARRRAYTAFVALTSFAWGQGCSSYQRPRSVLLTPGSNVRLQATTPLLVQRPGESTTDRACHATVVQGVLSAVAGDTLVFSQVKGVLAADARERACARLGAGTTVVRPSTGSTLTERRYSAARTTGLVLGLAAALVGFAAFAASQIEYDFGC